MATTRSFLQRMPLAPAIAALFGTAAAVLVAAMPIWMFEANIMASGLGALLPDAQPPLGIKARLLAIVAAFTFVALLVWLIVRAAESLIEGPLARVDDDDDALDLAGYAATLPDLPPRRPISAESELGAPLMSDEALKNAAILVEPPVVAEPVEAMAAEPVVAEMPVETLVAPFPDEVEAPLPAPQAVDEPAPVDTLLLAEPLSVDEFELPDAAESDVVTGESSIDTLIRRLEAGLSRRDQPLPPTPGGSSSATSPPSGDWMVRDATPPVNDDDRILGALRRMAR